MRSSEHEETAEDEGVVEARVRVAEHLPLQEPVLDHVPEARERTVEAVFGGPAEREELDAARRGVREKGKGGEQQEGEEERSGEAEVRGLGGRDRHRKGG